MCFGFAWNCPCKSGFLISLQPTGSRFSNFRQFAKNHNFDRDYCKSRARKVTSARRSCFFIFSRNPGLLDKRIVRVAPSRLEMKTCRNQKKEAETLSPGKKFCDHESPAFCFLPGESLAITLCHFDAVFTKFGRNFTACVFLCKSCHYSGPGTRG